MTIINPIITAEVAQLPNYSVQQMHQIIARYGQQAHITPIAIQTVQDDTFYPIKHDWELVNWFQQNAALHVTQLTECQEQRAWLHQNVQDNFVKIDQQLNYLNPTASWQQTHRPQLMLTPQKIAQLAVQMKA